MCEKEKTPEVEQAPNPEQKETWYFLVRLNQLLNPGVEVPNFENTEELTEAEYIFPAAL